MLEAWIIEEIEKERRREIEERPGLELPVPDAIPGDAGYRPCHPDGLDDEMPESRSGRVIIIDIA